MSPSSSHPHPSPAFKIMSFNIRYGTAQDGPNSWDHRKHLVIDTILQESPDILCLQEALDFQTTYIVDEVRRNNTKEDDGQRVEFWMYEKYGKGREWDHTGEAVHVLVKRPLFDNHLQHHNQHIDQAILNLEVTNHWTFWLSSDPYTPGSKTYGNTLPRIATALEIKCIYPTHSSPQAQNNQQQSQPSTTSTSRKLLVINTHLDHASSESRARSISQILQTSQWFQQQKDWGILITGDFNNFTITSPEIKQMVSNDFVDCYYQLHGEWGKGTFHGFAGEGREMEPRIDFIWTKKETLTGIQEGEILEVLDAKVVKNKNSEGRYPSDHYPVTATLRFL
jgi:endonuclease/exonuclease/phosphatase family metal-dependent hydrolase